jgi:acyl-coenzyme A thioesterase PaaI-like protein
MGLRMVEPAGKIGFPLTLGKMLQLQGWDSLDKCVRGAVHFLPSAAGPSGTVHGGAIFTILDECMGVAAKLQDPHGLRLTAACTLTYKGRCLVRRTHEISTALVSKEDRGDRGLKLIFQSCVLLDGVIKAEMEGVFIVQPRVGGATYITNTSEKVQSEIGRQLYYNEVGIPASLDADIPAFSLRAMRRSWEDQGVTECLRAAGLDMLELERMQGGNAKSPDESFIHFCTGRLWYQCFWHKRQCLLVNPIRFLKYCEGHPKYSHGGATATAFDQMFGSFLLTKMPGIDVIKNPPFTVALKVAYKALIPLEETLICRVWVVLVEATKSGRLRIQLEADLRSPNGNVLYANSAGTFVSSIACRLESIASAERMTLKPGEEKKAQL